MKTGSKSRSQGGEELLRLLMWPCLFTYTILARRAAIVAQWAPEGSNPMNEDTLLERITTDPEIYSGKLIVRGHRLAVEHVLSMLAAGDTFETVLAGYPWLEREDIQACLVYAKRLVAHERIERVSVKADG